MTNYETYMQKFQHEIDPLIIEMEQYAANHFVPIMERSGLETLKGLLTIQQPKRLLEIGSAIGYSAIRLAQSINEMHITTIERDEIRHAKATEYIHKSNVKERISIMQADALLFNVSNLPYDTYDALFIDAAKGQYKRFFEKYESCVGSGGIIYCDNMFMHGMVFMEDNKLPKRNRTMIRNLKAFTEWIMENPVYETSLLPVGDGILVARKR